MSPRNIRVVRASDRNRRQAVIFDVDGVLCDSEEYTTPFKAKAREELGPAPEGVSEWNWFGQSAVWEEYDPSEAGPIVGWLTLSQLLYHAGYYIILLTAREDNEFKREQLARWVERHGLQYDVLVMWKKDCDYDDHKRIACEELMKEYDILLAIDDHVAHCEAFRSHGIPFLHAHPESLK